MKIEKIEKFKFRCLLTAKELSAMHLSVQDLVYSGDDAHLLFRQVIQEAQREIGFNTGDSPLMVEAVPMEDQSLLLIVSTVLDPEEIDPRYSVFSPSEDIPESTPALSRDKLEGADSFTENLHRSYLDLSGAAAAPDNAISADHAAGSPDDKAKKESAATVKSALPMPQTKIGGQISAGNRDPEAGIFFRPRAKLFLFDTLDDVIIAARAVPRLEHINSTLYQDPASRTYYLIVSQDETLSDDFTGVCNLLSEFGRAVRSNPVAMAHFAEHYSCILAEGALTKLAGI